MIRKNFTVPFLKYKRLKLKLRVFLAGHSVAMVTYCVTKIIPTCLPVIGQFFGLGFRKVALNLAFKVPNLGPAFSSILQIGWCRKFAETLKPSVSVLYGAGRCLVMQL